MYQYPLLLAVLAVATLMWLSNRKSSKSSSQSEVEGEMEAESMSMSGSMVMPESMSESGSMVMSGTGTGPMSYGNSCTNGNYPNCRLSNRFDYFTDSRSVQGATTCGGRPRMPNGNGGEYAMRHQYEHDQDGMAYTTPDGDAMRNGNGGRSYDYARGCGGGMVNGMNGMTNGNGQNGNGMDGMNDMMTFGNQYEAQQSVNEHDKSMMDGGDDDDDYTNMYQDGYHPGVKYPYPTVATKSSIVVSGPEHIRGRDSDMSSEYINDGPYHARNRYAHELALQKNGSGVYNGDHMASNMSMADADYDNADRQMNGAVPTNGVGSINAGSGMYTNLYYPPCGKNKNFYHHGRPGQGVRQGKNYTTVYSGNSFRLTPREQEIYNHLYRGNDNFYQKVWDHDVYSCNDGLWNEKYNHLFNNLKKKESQRYN